MAGRPVVLPENVYLLREYSGGLESGNFEFSGAGGQDGASGNACLVVDFDGRGLLQSPTGARLVFSRGTAADAEPPETMLAGRRGILLRKYGSAAPFQTVDQMQKVSGL
jgi:hypothetical protein